jgi:ferredoxin-NADP reductase
MIRARDTELRRVRVTAIGHPAVDVRSYDLVAADGRALPPFTPGAHLDVHLHNGSLRQYSLCSDPRVRDRYRIAVKREVAGRGGSASMHEDVEEGSVLAIAGPRNHFPLSARARHSLLIAGGIGITPIYAMIQALHAGRSDWSLHYCARSEAHAAFYEELRALAPGRVHTYFSEAPTLNPASLLHLQPAGGHVYCCGPQSLMHAVASAADHWSKGSVHFEWFSAPTQATAPNRPLQVKLERRGLTLLVPADRSILQVLREHGIDLPSACEGGICGTCETNVLSGVPEHRDLLLSQDERAAGRSMMICVSRADSDLLVLDV